MRFCLLLSFALGLAAAPPVINELQPRGAQKGRPFTGVDHYLEHSFAFALIGLAFALGYPRYRVALTMLAVAVIGLMEILQHWIPGRHANVRDFVVNAVGVCKGIADGALADVLRRRREHG